MVGKGFGKEKRRTPTVGQKYFCQFWRILAQMWPNLSFYVMDLVVSWYHVCFVLELCTLIKVWTFAGNKLPRFRYFSGIYECYLRCDIVFSVPFAIVYICDIVLLRSLAIVYTREWDHGDEGNFGFFLNNLRFIYMIRQVKCKNKPFYLINLKYAFLIINPHSPTDH